MSLLILPGDPRFEATLQTASHPMWAAKSADDGYGAAYVVEPGSGLLRPASGAELEEYLYGGEYEERQRDIGEWEEDEV